MLEPGFKIKGLGGKGHNPFTVLRLLGFYYKLFGSVVGGVGNVRAT